MNISDAARDFLAQDRIAIVGASRNANDFTRFILKRLISSNRQVVPVNPRASAIEGLPCYPDLKSIPARVDAVLVATPSESTAGVIRECVELGISRVWLHRSFGRGSTSTAAVEEARKGNITLINGACPMMYCEPVDVAHRCVRWMLRVTGRLPKPMERAEGLNTEG